MPLGNLLARWRRTRARRSLPVVGAMATMPTRADSFRVMLDSVLPQLDLLYVFLDGFAEIPAWLSGLAKCRVELIPADSPLHNASRLLAPARFGAEAVFLFLDDDILYPADYVQRILAGLRRYDYRAWVGFHGTLFLPPHERFVLHRKTFPFFKRLKRDRQVHLLGCGTLACHSALLGMNPEGWRHPRLDDLYMATEAAGAGIDLIALRRPARWLRAIAQNQPDSMWRQAQDDDRVPSRLMRELIRHLGERGPRIAGAEWSARQPSTT
ncbi:hypothetical protein EZJ19_10230 [Parasulfuritortus cantonensis]|uniref:Glycosyltransferase family 2 protein n=1 Tax=Parasulfuritortus cantonensis TaxID=2528202 RepID=A0A4R1B9A8_9PROT|nr:hypothetical protein [Parasulfuritortus cantonensis]TCJ13419.1 hypothetical protein EZJ19_10230 [Parasulfuritortus cantonensis]